MQRGTIRSRDKSAAQAAMRQLEGLRRIFEFQDIAAFAAAMPGVPITAGGVDDDAATAGGLAKKWLDGHDLELTFTVPDSTFDEVRLEVHAVWTDNNTFERCSGRFEFRQRWTRTLTGWKLAGIELTHTERLPPMPPGSRLGRSPRTTGRVLAFTVATRPDPCLDDLEEGCRRHGIPLEIIGKGAPWHGFSYAKLRLLYWYLESHADDIEIAFFTDGYDTMVADRLETIVTKFRRMQAPIVFTAEANCYPGGPGVNETDYPPAPTRYRFLNAGGWIAELPAMLAVLRTGGAGRIPPHRCDQAWWSRAYLTGRYGIQLDHECEIFQCLFLSIQDLKKEGKRPRNIITGTLPSVIHANGWESLVPWSDYLLGRYYRRVPGRALLRLVEFYTRYSPLLRLIRVWQQHAAIRASAPPTSGPPPLPASGDPSQAALQKELQSER